MLALESLSPHVDMLLLEVKFDIMYPTTPPFCGTPWVRILRQSLLAIVIEELLEVYLAGEWCFMQNPTAVWQVGRGAIHAALAENSCGRSEGIGC